MSIHRHIFKVMTCLAVIGLAMAPAYEAQAQQTTQQANCSQQNSNGCTQNADPSSTLQNGSPYDNSSMYFAPGARDVTHANPEKQPDTDGNSGH